MNNKKRKGDLIELHCHTKMSAKKGLIDAGDLVKYAYEKGYKAIAITDCDSVQAFPEAYKTWKELWNQHVQKCKQDGVEAKKEDFLKIIYGMEGNLIDENGDIYSVLILVRNQIGLSNLYKLISYSLSDHFVDGKALLPKKLINEYRDGLLIGTCCDGGEVFKTICSSQTKHESIIDIDYISRIRNIIEFYDFLEIVSFERTSANDFCLERYMYFASMKINTRPMVVTSDAYYLEPDDKDCWDIQTFNEVNVDRPRHLQKYDDDCLKYFQRWHSSMPKEFKSFPNKIIKDRDYIANQIEEVIPIVEERLWPKYPNAEKELDNICRKRAKEIFGKKLNSEVKERLQRELDAVNKNGYAGLYLMWKKLVEKSHEKGYPTISRGSAASSLIAYLCGITDINPLSEKNGGYNIPEEILMGINLNKIPDININFADEIRYDIQDYVWDLPGVYAACVCSTIARYTDYSLKRKISEYKMKKSNSLYNSLNSRKIIKKLLGVKINDGVYSGGIMALPEQVDIYSITPFLERYNGRGGYDYITHHEYHYLEDSLLKFDILSFRYLDRLHFLLNKTGIKLEEIPLDDMKVIKKLNNKRIKEINDFPEFGYEETRKIVFETNPNCFNDYVKICGLGHGTDVWKDNQDILIKNRTITLSECISSRDDIMLFLMDKGLSRKDAYYIMKSVYMGKGLKKNHEEMMKEKNVPDWYIDVCDKIKYLFPKAHAISYTKMAFHLAYFLVYFTKEYKLALSLY